MSDEHGRIWVYTAGHCIGSMESGKLTKFQAIRVRVPVLPNYENDPTPHARFKKDDHRFQQYYVYKSHMFIYPNYYADENCRNGTDFGMILLDNYDSAANPLNFSQIRSWDLTSESREIDGRWETQHGSLVDVNQSKMHWGDGTTSPFRLD